MKSHEDITTGNFSLLSELLIRHPGQGAPSNLNGQLQPTGLIVFWFLI